MITKTTIYTRPNPDVAFPESASPALQSHINTTYRGAVVKMISKSQTISEDLRTLTTVTVFSDKAALDEFENDPVRADYIAARDAHVASSGIIVASTEE
jgi:hypothetical protein